MKGSSSVVPTGTARISSDTPNFTVRRPYCAGVRTHVGSVRRTLTWCKVLEDDGSVLIGRVVGFEGDFIEGKGRVEAMRRANSGPRACPPDLTDRSCCGITPCRI